MSTTPVSAEVCYDAVTPDSGVHENFSNLSPEDQEKQREEWKSDLVKTEEEIQMLRQVLGSKIKQAQDLKRRLGITVWREFTDDFNASLKSVRESQTYQKVASTLTGAGETISQQPLYQKTAGALSAAGEKTSSLFGGLGAKIGQIKETPTFKSFEERVGSAYNSARQTRMGGSRSNSTQNFEDALKEAEGEKAANGSTPATTPSANTDEMQQQQQQAAS
ncbi:tumor protein D54-like isoform X2 [Oratosquilla oratoria]|uniref:tumor protein D54-like isoform X2 n=1 Tax=Oratosquilla oratoria TaxID=337810 RepID=UPI003F75DF15